MLHSRSVNYLPSTRGFNGSVNIPESCDFRSQFDPLNIIFLPFSWILFLSAYTFFWIFLNEKIYNKQICKVKDCWIEQNMFGFKQKNKKCVFPSQEIISLCWQMDLKILLQTSISEDIVDFLSLKHDISLNSWITFCLFE